MDPLPSETLTRLLGQFGADLANDPRRLKALLQDNCPQQRREVAVLVAAAEEGIPGRLAGGSVGSAPGQVVRLSGALEAARGLSPEAARWAVASWAAALGVPGAGSHRQETAADPVTGELPRVREARPDGPTTPSPLPRGASAGEDYAAAARDRASQEARTGPADQAADPAPAGVPGGERRRDRSVQVAAGVGAAIAVAAVSGYLVAAPGDTTEPRTPEVSPSPALAASPTTAPVPNSPASTPPAAPPPSTPVSATAPGDVRAQPAGLFCRDLAARSYSYSAAVDYWRLHGQPERMDADKNGIPCETVYPRSSVIAYFQGAPAFDPPSTVPSGLLCRDLADRGLSYSDAVGYWFTAGAPDRMDVDKNGIPCETVYSASDVQAYWG